ncbi:ABC transporter ATP-binding/permease protein [Gottschalkia acidurici 9a]|uniref:ABC transporter ATP-binding/permease protein n=1 Tax=Gottschalkia acidurici (strain ATCC 7906 / DSM 604 / BCRC 14475 / CIP 104303 / KCTC 5404 / NCIMB 10678 / 9a) TaxID=1128398 RepID=K0AUF6_GOTA9|nr:ABC transporter ATP-binding protein [Gottschalkia acidurici]AFS77483.1 ABC transporter ATP-binding/permease protein [Gottschalkia acidurici 9a]
MISTIKAIIGKDIKKLYLPITLMFLDSLGMMTFIGVLYKLLMDISSDSFTMDKLKIYTSILIGSFIFRCIMISVGYKLNHLRGSDIIKDMRVSLGDHIRSLNLGYFNKNSIGNLMNILTADVTDFERILTHSLGDIIKAIVLIPYIIIISFFIDTRIALAQLITILIAAPILIASGKMAQKFGLRKRAVLSDVISRIIEYINGIKVFKSYNQTGDKFKRLEDSFRTFKKESIMIELSVAPFVLAFQILSDFILPVVLLTGSYILLGGNIDEKTFIAFLIISISLTNILKGLSAQYPEYKALKLAAEKIISTYDKKSLEFSKDKVDFKNFDIEFKDVTFGYEEEKDILKNISFKVKEGTTTALVGPSGSGKTTITSLIARFWDNDKGEIKIGENNISNINPDYILQHISVVFQDVYLLNDTIYNNIKLGRPNASYEEVVKAAKLANCHEFIEKLKGKYETMIGEGGSTLSGGEKQRISIARAILKDSPIILLDEATASLDADNEIEIQRSLEKLTEGKTVIVIAHKLNTIVNSDQIIVLNDGKIEEIGNHEELVKNKRRYYNMYKEQEEAKGWVV